MCSFIVLRLDRHFISYLSWIEWSIAVLSGGYRHRIKGEPEFVIQTTKALSDTLQITTDTDRFQPDFKHLSAMLHQCCLSVNVDAKKKLRRLRSCQKETELLCCIIFFFFTRGLWLLPRITLRFHSCVSWTRPHYMSPARRLVAKWIASEKSWSGSHWSGAVRRVGVSRPELILTAGWSAPTVRLKSFLFLYTCSGLTKP